MQKPVYSVMNSQNNSCRNVTLKQNWDFWANIPPVYFHSIMNLNSLL